MPNWLFVVSSLIVAGQRMKARVADLEAELRVAKLIAPKNAVEQHGPDSRAPVSLGKTSSNCQPASPNMTAPNIEGTVDRSSSDGSGSYLPKGQCIQGENYADESSAANDLTPDEYRDISNVLSASDIDSWPLEALRTEIQGHPAGPLGSDLHLHTGNLFDTQEMQTGIRHTSIEASSSSSTSPNLERLPLDERLDHIMKIANDMSFDSFDAVAEAYYISNFTPSSHLVNEQRLSRSRRLPNLLAKLCDAADHWSSWESRGFHDEIIKKAESLLVAENLAARQALAVAMSPIANRNHQEVQLSIDNFVAELKAKAPKEVGYLPTSCSINMYRY